MNGLNSSNSLFGVLSKVGPDVLSWALALLAQATVPLAIVMVALHLLRRRGPATRLFLANSTLFAVLALAILSVCLAGRYHARWTFALPASAPDNVMIRGEDRVYIPIHSGSTEETSRVIEMIPLPAVGRGLVNRAQGGMSGGALSNGMRTFGAVIRHPINPARASLPAAVPAHGVTGAATTEQRISEQPTSRPPISTPLWKRLPLAARYRIPVVLWGAGVLLLLSWLAVSCASVALLRRRCLPVTDHRALAILWEQSAALGVVPPQLLVSDRARGPFLTGLLRPAIVLPAGYETDFATEDLRAVLTHELAHLAQHDGWWMLLARLLCALCWPHPLLWSLCRQRAEAGEEACDMMVLTQGCSGTAYARCLVALADRLQPSARERAATLGVIGSRSALGRRVEQILRGVRQLPPALTFSVKLPVFVLIPALICAALYFVGAAAHKRPQPPIITSIVIPRPNTDAVRLRALETECALARQQVAENEAQLALLESALQQAYVRYDQQLADQAQAQAALAGTQAKLTQAQAAEGAAKAQLAHMQQQLDVQRVSLKQAQVQLELATVTNARYQTLLQKGFVARQDVDQSAATLKTRAADVESAQAAVQSAQDERARARAQVEMAQARHVAAHPQLDEQKAVIAQLQQQVMMAQQAVAAARQRLAAAELALAAERLRQGRNASVNRASQSAAEAVVAAQNMEVATAQATLEATRPDPRGREVAVQLRQQLLIYQAKRNEALAEEMQRRQNAEMAAANARLAQENARLPVIAPSGPTPSRMDVWTMALQVIDAQAQLDKIRAVYTANHPRVKAGEEWLDHLVTQRNRMLDAALPQVQYDVLNLIMNGLQHTRNVAMDRLVDLKYQYTARHPAILAAQRTLDGVNAEMRGIEARRERLYAEMKAAPAPADASLTLTRFTVHFDGEPLQADDTRVFIARRGADGVMRTISYIRPGDRLAWRINLMDYTAKSLEAQVSRVADYYDRDGHLLKSDVQTFPPYVEEVVYAGNLSTGGNDLRTQKFDGAPAGATTVKYHYELRVKILNENGPHSSDMRSSDTHTLDLSKTASTQSHSK